MNKHFLILLATAVVTTYSQSRPTVCSSVDDLCYNGAWLDAPNSKYASFQEIRYALAPTGNLRFKSPKKYLPSGINLIQVNSSQGTTDIISVSLSADISVSVDTRYIGLADKENPLLVKMQH